VSNYTDWPQKKFRELPTRKHDETILCDCLVILPTRKIHDSGFRCMDAVAVVGNEPLCLVSGVSDVIHIDGIGGFGEWNPGHGIPASVPAKGWSIDCLPGSGLLRIWPNHPTYQLKITEPYSSLEIYAVKRNK